jgi:hypothetical protein
MLAATVKAGAVGVSPGQVDFCDASATSCTDIHLLGTAQLFQTDPTAGTAFFAFRPGIGSHRYKAIFVGTPNGVSPCAGSSSLRCRSWSLELVKPNLRVPAAAMWVIIR